MAGEGKGGHEESNDFDKDDEGGIEEMLMAKAKPRKSPNADLVKAVQDRTEDILDFYEVIEDDRPVIVLDYQKQTINAYHYEEYEATLSTESQAVYDQEYEKAVAEDKVLVVVWDRETGRLVITTFDRD